MLAIKPSPHEFSCHFDSLCLLIWCCLVWVSRRGAMRTELKKKISKVCHAILMCVPYCALLLGIHTCSSLWSKVLFWLVLHFGLQSSWPKLDVKKWLNTKSGDDKFQSDYYSIAGELWFLMLIFLFFHFWFAVGNFSSHSMLH